MYAKETFHQELSSILAPLFEEEDLPPSRIGPRLKKAGKCIITAKEQLDDEAFWAAIEQAGISRTDAWRMTTFFQDKMQAEMSLAPLFKRFQATLQDLDNLGQAVKEDKMSAEDSLKQMADILVDQFNVADALDKQADLPPVLPMPEPDEQESRLTKHIRHFLAECEAEREVVAMMMPPSFKELMAQSLKNALIKAAAKGETDAEEDS